VANQLLEKYSKKLQLAEAVYQKRHNGESMDSMRKVTVAKCLDNVSKFLNEAFDSSMGTQRSAMGDYKRFCLALTNVGLPNLIAFDLVHVSPMSSMYGNVAYIEYQKGTTKGESTVGDMTNNIWALGDVDTNYTGQAVVEPVDSFTSGTTKVAFLPVVEGSVKLLDADGVDLEATDVSVADDGTVTATVTGTVKKIAYKYDNVVIPQEKLPTLKAELKNIGLEARARRIAVFYSQMAAFQAKTDYGFDLADGLAEQAVGQLSYEIDTEICNMLIDAATEVATIADFSKTLPVGVNLADHYAAFAAKIEEYKMALYDRTKKFTPNFMLCASNLMPVIQFVPGFQAASVSDINGPYFAGTLAGLKVFVTPNIEAGKFILGVNQGAMQAAAGIYAPYMPVVPTQLLGFADGGMSQGWSTMYDCKILNADLLIAGKIVA
jgi:hypothetical protein